MMSRLLRRLAATLPAYWQNELRRLHHRRRIHQGTFVSDEPEFGLLPRVVAAGDCVIDIGANVGFYTKRLAELVGPSGRVLAFEPVPETFALLASNVQSCRLSNVTLLNAAASEASGVAGIAISRYADTGLQNFYQARIAEGDSELHILTLTVDALQIPMPVKLVKVDAEGHELAVLRGMTKMLMRDRPLLIVETDQGAVSDLLRSMDYTGLRLPGSPNMIFHRADLRSEELLRATG